jgi:nucleotide-binding universal stress UspA family protein
MRMLLAVDLSEGAEELVAQAVTWATRLSAKIDLAFVDEHAYNVYLVQDPSVRSVLDREWQKIREHQNSRLQELLSKVPEALRGEALILTGRAADEIVTASASRDLVMVCTHGRTGVNHALLGSVAERVVRLATVPVVVVRRKT